MIAALSSFCIDSQEVSDCEQGKQKRDLRTILKLRPKQWNAAIDRGGQLSQTAPSGSQQLGKRHLGVQCEHNNGPSGGQKARW